MPLNTEEGDHMGSRKGRRKSHLQKKRKKKRKMEALLCAWSQQTQSWELCQTRAGSHRESNIIMLKL